MLFSTPIFKSAYMGGHIWAAIYERFIWAAIQKYYTCEMNGQKQKSFITNTNKSSCLEMLEPNVVYDWTRPEMICLKLKRFT